MPAVPRYTQQVQPQELPKVSSPQYISAERVGGQASEAEVTQSASRMNSAVMQYANKIKKEADDSVNTKNYATTTNKINDLWWNQNDGVVTRQNEDAFGTLPEFEKRFADIFEEAETTSAHNPEQRAFVQHMKEQKWPEFRGRLQQREHVERVKVDESIKKAAVDTSIDDATKNWSLEGKIEDSLLKQQAALISWADRNDIPQEALDVERLNAASKLHVSVLDSMTAEGFDLKARQHFETYKDQLTGDDKTKVEKFLEIANSDGQALRLGKMIVDKHPLDLTAQYAERDKITDGKLYEKVTRLIENRNTEGQRALKQHEENIVKRSSERLLQAKKESPELGTNLWDKIPPADRAQITPKMQKEIEATVNPPPDSDWGVKNLLYTMARDNPGKFQGLHLGQYYADLSPSDRDRFHKLQTDLEKKDEKAQITLSKFDADKNALDTVAVEISLNPKAKSGSSARKQYEAFGRMAEEEIRATGARLGRELTPEEQKVEFRKVGVKVATQGKMYGTNQTPLFMINDIKQINKDEISLLRARLKSKNKPTDDANVLKVWKNWKKNAPR